MANPVKIMNEETNICEDHHPKIKFHTPCCPLCGIREEMERRVNLVKSEPDGLVRDSMISDLIISDNFLYVIDNLPF